MTFGDLLDAVKADWELREIKSLSQSLGRSERLRVTFGNRKAMTITTDVVRKYIAQRKAEGLKPATINRFTEIIGRAFQLAIDDKTLVSGPKIPHLPEKDAGRDSSSPLTTRGSSPTSRSRSMASRSSRMRRFGGAENYLGSGGSGSTAQRARSIFPTARTASPGCSLSTRRCGR